MPSNTLTDLVSLRELTEAQRKLLRSYGIGTVEELAGTIEADSSAVRNLLGLDHAAFNALRAAIDAVLDKNQQLREQFRLHRGREYPLGALDPTGAH